MLRVASSRISQDRRGGTRQTADRPAGSTDATARTYRWLMATLALLFALNVVVFAMRPADGASYAVIVLPHLGEASLMETIASADGTLVRQSRYPWLAIARPANAADAPVFSHALRQAGALLLLHPAVLAGCFTPASTSRQAARPIPSPFPFARPLRETP